MKKLVIIGFFVLFLGALYPVQPAQAIVMIKNYSRYNGRYIHFDDKDNKEGKQYTGILSILNIFR